MILRMVIMNKIFYITPEKIGNKKILSPEKIKKVSATLVEHVYTQTNTAMAAAAFCATVIFIGLFEVNGNNSRLYAWSGIFLTITIFRILLATSQKKQKSSEEKYVLWRKLYILGSMLGGLSWGLLSIFMFPYVTPIHKMLIILMLAGVSAGAVPLSAAIPEAAICFLTLSLMPFIVSIALFNNKTYLLFDLAVTIYLMYCCILSLKTYYLIKNSITLTFENDILLNNLEISNRKLAQAATHDPLTQAANRSFFESNFKEAIKIARENKKIVALLYLDLDNFKKINDTYGHYTGDRILIIVIDRLKHFFGNKDSIARLGGDEIAIILENMNTMEEIEMIAHKLCELIAMPIHIDHLNLNISASIGISIYPYDGSDEESLMQCSDKRMYSVKETGGNNFIGSAKHTTY